MLLLHILLAAPVVWLAATLAGIEDDARDIFNVAVISALVPPLVRFAAVLAIAPALRDGSAPDQLLQLLGSLLLYYPFQALVTALAAKRLLVADWRQAITVGAAAAGTNMVLDLLVRAYLSVIAVDP